MDSVFVVYTALPLSGPPCPLTSSSLVLKGHNRLQGRRVGGGKRWGSSLVPWLVQNEMQAYSLCVSQIPLFSRFVCCPFQSFDFLLSLCTVFLPLVCLISIFWDWENVLIYTSLFKTRFIYFVPRILSLRLCGWSVSVVLFSLCTALSFINIPCLALYFHSAQCLGKNIGSTLDVLLKKAAVVNCVDYIWLLSFWGLPIRFCISFTVGKPACSLFCRLLFLPVPLMSKHGHKKVLS